MIRAVLIRLNQNRKQTLGRLFIFKGLDIEYECCTLELPDNNNKRNISCIPTGEYNVKPRTSEKYGKHYLVENVENRDYILIHPANYYTQLRGCIAVGSDFYDINKDGECDITYSRKTMAQLLDNAPDGFNLIIIDNA
tara:strand:+ start:5448 stop:5861 length:414 start_codon:yes stop_codon:yes gene_type:complete